MSAAGITTGRADPNSANSTRTRARVDWPAHKALEAR
jgi:hypothetical protein